jgi:hypothetical protein
MKSVGKDEKSVVRPITGQVKSTLDASYRGGGTRGLPRPRTLEPPADGRAGAAPSVNF